MSHPRTPLVPVPPRFAMGDKAPEELQDGRWIEHPDWDDHPLAVHRGTPHLVLVAAEGVAKRA